MSANVYNNIDELVNSVIVSYMEAKEIAVIIDTHAVMPFLKKLLSCKVNGVEFCIETSCEDVLFDDFQNSEELNEPFMISVMKDGVVLTERFHSEYNSDAYTDMWYFIDVKYRDRIHNLNPEHFSLFETDFDPLEMM